MGNRCVYEKLDCLKRNPLRGLMLISVNHQKQVAMLGFSSNNVLLSVKVYDSEKICLAALFVRNRFWFEVFVRKHLIKPLVYSVAEKRDKITIRRFKKDFKHWVA